MTFFIWFFHHLLSIIVMLSTLALVSKVLTQRRAPGSTIAWLLGMVLIPYVGIPLFLLIGDRKIKRIAAQKNILYPRIKYGETPAQITQVERILLSSGVPPQTHTNHFEPLETGEKAFATILQGIQSAKSTIHYTTFILGNDPVGRAILDALCKKAREGIQVRLLLDGIGSLWFPKARLKQLTEAGGKYALFVPLIRVPFSAHSNLRNHRKMVLIDGKEAILGGMNSAADYMGPSPNKKRWTDFSFLIRGEALKDFESLFKSDWTYASGEHLSPRQISGTPEGKTPLQVIASGPDVPADPIYDALLTQIFSAKRRIWIATPYFIPDETLARALELACRRDIDVRILIPAHSNHFLADLCRGSYLKQVFHAGGHLCFFGPQMMHAKVTLIDDSFALIGSANLDMRSLLLNYEVSVLLSSEASVKSIADWFETIFKHAHEAHPKNRWGSSFVDGIGRILGPML